MQRWSCPHPSLLSRARVLAHADPHPHGSKQRPKGGTRRLLYDSTQSSALQFESLVLTCAKMLNSSMKAHMLAADQQRLRVKEVLDLAYGYPYPRLDASFVFMGGKAWAFDTATWPGISGLLDLQVTSQPGKTCTVAHAAQRLGLDVHKLRACSRPEDWMAVLAIGSNASPQQLARKYSHDNQCFIPVVQCVLEDFDVVYCAGISRYGSCTATLARSPGTRVLAHLMYLQPEQLNILNASEGGNYQLCRLSGITLHVGTSRLLNPTINRQSVKEHVMAYTHVLGSLLLPADIDAWSQEDPGVPVALDAVEAHCRSYEALPQRDMLDRIRYLTSDHVFQHRGRTSPEPATLDDWVLQAVQEPHTREAMDAWLRQHALPLGDDELGTVDVLERFADGGRDVRASKKQKARLPRRTKVGLQNTWPTKAGPFWF